TCSVAVVLFHVNMVLIEKKICDALGNRSTFLPTVNLHFVDVELVLAHGRTVGILGFDRIQFEISIRTQNETIFASAEVTIVVHDSQGRLPNGHHAVVCLWGTNCVRSDDKPIRSGANIAWWMCGLTTKWLTSVTT